MTTTLTNPNRVVRVKDLNRFKQRFDVEAALHPVNINSVTLTSTFVKNSIIGINGVIYHSTTATENLPCTLVTQDGALVVNTINGKTAFVVSDPTPNTGWEIWTDAAIEYWVNSINTRLTALEGMTITYGDHTYTATQLLTAMAELMEKTMVVTGG